MSGIPDFFSCLRDSKAKKFRILRAEISGIPVGEMHNRVTALYTYVTVQVRVTLLN